MYNEFYGFSEKPFEIDPDPKFLYLPPRHKKVVDSLIQNLQKREKVILITGPPGTGKTALIHFLFSTLGENTRKVLVFNPIITFKELITYILLELEQPIAGKGKQGLLDQLVSYLSQLKEKGQTLMVVIDDAQRLKRDVLNRLESFLGLGAGLIQIVLVGQPELEGILGEQGMRQVKEKILAKHQIHSFTEEESHLYIDYRLRIVGSSSSHIFTPKAISMISHVSNGNPSRINIVCDNALRIGHKLFKKQIDGDVIQKVISALEDPFPKPSRFSQGLKRFSASRPSLKVFLKRVSLAALLLLFVTGLALFLYGYIQQPFQENMATRVPSSKAPAILSAPVLLEDQEASKQGSPSLPRETEQPFRESPEPLPPPAAAPPQPRGFPLTEEVTVRNGETLSHLMWKHYSLNNPTLIDLIMTFNPEIDNIHLIKVNQKIKLPKITEALLVIQSDNTYKIHAGTFAVPDPSVYFRDEPALKGKRVEILPRKVSPRETWYRLVIGRFDTQEESLKTISVLKEKGLVPAFGGVLE